MRVLFLPYVAAVIVCVTLVSRRLASQPQLYKRAARLGHPPVLMRGSQKLVYGPAVPAPWNSSMPPPTPAGPGASLANGKPAGAETKDAKEGTKVPDARLFATWDYEQKHFWEPLPIARGFKAKGAQIQLKDVPAASGVGIEGTPRRPSGLTIQVGRKDSIASRRDSMPSASAK